ncbi:MAG: YHS domain-containing protein [Thermoplasmatales archaeon]|nr:YHS domain-containing protein [Thermoplasmatales archaeon]
MGKTFYFCSNDCKTQFDADPHKYAHESKSHSHGGGCC